MPRRNFIQVLREGRIDIKNEYSKLYSMFYERDTRDNKSLAEIISFNLLIFLLVELVYLLKNLMKCMIYILKNNHRTLI